MNKFKLSTALAIVALTGAVLTGNAFAQTGTTAKESGKAIAEKAREGKETAQAAVISEPKKAAHKAEAAGHDTKAKAAGEQIGK
jgi:hypothetical protein